VPHPMVPPRGPDCRHCFGSRYSRRCHESSGTNDFDASHEQCSFDVCFGDSFGLWRWRQGIGSHPGRRNDWTEYGKPWKCCLCRPTSRVSALPRIWSAIDAARGRRVQASGWLWLVWSRQGDWSGKLPTVG
jgi:hypothetical protein